MDYHRYCREYISSPLCHILNLSIETSTVPATWKIAIIIPIYKSGSYDQPENYRPISVLPVLSKLLKKSIHRQLMNFLEDENLISKYQFGYRSKRSTNLAATLLIDDIRREGEK